MLTKIRSLPTLLNDPERSLLIFNISIKILDKRALQDLVKEVDPTEQLDEDVEDVPLIFI